MGQKYKSGLVSRQTQSFPVTFTTLMQAWVPPRRQQHLGYVTSPGTTTSPATTEHHHVTSNNRAPGGFFGPSGGAVAHQYTGARLSFCHSGASTRFRVHFGRYAVWEIASPTCMCSRQLDQPRHFCLPTCWRSRRHLTSPRSLAR